MDALDALMRCLSRPINGVVGFYSSSLRRSRQRACSQDVRLGRTPPSSLWGFGGIQNDAFMLVIGSHLEAKILPVHQQMVLGMETRNIYMMRLSISNSWGLLFLFSYISKSRGHEWLSVPSLRLDTSPDVSVDEAGRPSMCI